MTVSIDIPATAESPANLYAADLNAATGRIDSYIDALLNLRTLVAERPDIAHAIRLDRSGLLQFNVCLTYMETSDLVGDVAELAEAARANGAVVTPHVNTSYAGVIAKFGPFQLYVFAAKEELGTTVTREVAEFELDPRLAAFGSEANR